MKRRFLLASGAIVAAGALALTSPGILPQAGRIASAWAGPGHDHGPAPKPGADKGQKAGDKHGAADKQEAGHDHDDEGLVHMTPAEAAAHGVDVAVAGPGVLTMALSAPGVIAPDSDRIARIAARVVGTVAVLNKRLGDAVSKDEIIAELDSREVAEARSEYFAALTNLELQKTLFAREQELWNRRVSAEQQYLRARNSLREVELRVELAAQKLTALGLSPGDVAASRNAGASQSFQRYPLRSPISGRVVERRVDLGAPVGGEGQEKELYVIADLSKVWIDLAIPADELSRIHEGQEVRVAAQDGAATKGRVIFVSPMLTPDTRSARVIAELDNAGLRWRPGGFVTARVTVGEEPVGLRIPRAATQTINGRPAVFVQTPEGFRIRNVVLGRDDGVHVAVTSGLAEGELVATRNAFLLKAELGKAEAEHAH
ncbi:efflux RND transporter periplasmic adaptor subunit [Camelimonas sp. ID_303_24]